MADSKTQLCNLALSHLGTGQTIANFDTERSNEATACRTFYETALKATMRDAPWSFLTKIIALGLVEEDPNVEWGFSYRYPSDCIYFRRILSGTRNDTQATRVPYKIASDAAGQLVFTDTQDAECEYTYYIDSPGLHPADFDLAFSFRLAALIAPILTGGDPAKVGARAYEMYRVEISKADAASYNEEQFERVPDSEFVRARE